VTRREALYVHDEPDHSLTLTEMEGVPLQYEVGVAGEFVSRGASTSTIGPKLGPHAGICDHDLSVRLGFQPLRGKRDAKTKVTSGTWKTYKGTGKLATVKGRHLSVKAGDTPMSSSSPWKGITNSREESGAETPAAARRRFSYDR